jgi:hypothetical protein
MRKTRSGFDFSNKSHFYPYVYKRARGVLHAAFGRVACIGVRLTRVRADVRGRAGARELGVHV